MFPLKDDNPVQITPIITLALIAFNVLIFLYQVSLGYESSRLFVYQFGTIPAIIAGNHTLPPAIETIPPALSIFTSMFLHGGWMHLIGNMWFLWIFGNNIEEAMGGLRYLVFYLLCGIIASWSHILSNPDSIIPTVGASGAIAGVLGAYIMLYPRARIWTLILLGFFSRLIYIPAGIILGYWFLIQVANGSIAGMRAVGGVAFWAHIGGFVAGIALVGLFKKRNIRFFNPPRYRAAAGED
jgi:membrane associated rhomboid family serine protease